jgi:hypothetical protein
MFGPPPPADGTCPKCGEPPDIGLHLCPGSGKIPDKVMSGNRCGRFQKVTVVDQVWQEEFCENHLPCPDHSWQPSKYNFEYHDGDGLALVTFDNGKQVTIRFLDNRITIEPQPGVQLGTDELPGKLIIEVS